MTWRTVYAAAIVGVFMAWAGDTPVPRLSATSVPGADLSGAWDLNRDLSSAPGGGVSGVDSGGSRPRGIGRRPGGGGFGGGRAGGGPGGRGGGRKDGERPSREDLEARRALMEEMLELPAHFTIAQDGEKVVFIEPDGVVRTYLANAKSEHHQLTNGTIDTTSAWVGPTLEMRIAAGPRGAIVRTFELRADPRRLAVTTRGEHGPKDAGRVAIYDQAER